MGLQIDIVQDPAAGAGADGWDDVQALGHRFLSQEVGSKSSGGKPARPLRLNGRGWRRIESDPNFDAPRSQVAATGHAAACPSPADSARNWSAIAWRSAATSARLCRLAVWITTRHPFGPRPRS